jgi:SAM-dependent methyltransferase
VLDSLHRRPRGRALAPALATLSELTGGRVRAPTHAEIEEDAARRRAAAETAAQAERARRMLAALERRTPPVREHAVGPPSRALLERIDEDDLAELRRRVHPDWDPLWERSDPATAEHLKLILGVHYDVESILAKTGLRRDEPPEEVHAMGRGALAAGGDFWIADIVAGAAERCGVRFGAGTRTLDFGCSSGRHLRVLQAWLPEAEWLGCDPNDAAIDWAREHLPGIEFFVSPQEPPLDLGPASLDVVSAISVWSHFGAGAAERWLGEMRRLVRPGGVLVLTVQGVGSVAAYLRRGEIPPEHTAEAVEDLLAADHHYREWFGEHGDWGVRSTEWGMAYMTLEWLATRATPAWSVALFEPTRIDDNQDLVVLRREEDA